MRNPGSQTSLKFRFFARSSTQKERYILVIKIKGGENKEGSTLSRPQNQVKHDGVVLRVLTH